MGPLDWWADHILCDCHHLFGVFPYDTWILLHRCGCHRGRLLWTGHDSELSNGFCGLQWSREHSSLRHLQALSEGPILGGFPLHCSD
ncbi:unnamed protein product [Symbiodinium necroappetens]|uniref:Uncharacterized protein n=1 Tax=Symbiodinium necroappetens TaxID=1628268 RepID=A0A812QPN0_9DINO|nr:unnamed protein product [Symbiodinium necroappetens]